MYIEHWYVLTGLAVAALGATYLTDLDEIIGGAAGTLLWALWAFGATNLEHREGVCCVFSTSEPGLAAFGAAMAGISVLIALKGVGLILAPGREGLEADLDEASTLQGFV